MSLQIDNFEVGYELFLRYRYQFVFEVGYEFILKYVMSEFFFYFVRPPYNTSIIVRFAIHISEVICNF